MMRNSTDTCYVDEIIINNNEAVYGALILRISSPVSTKRLKEFVHKNIHLIKQTKDHPKYLKELKGGFFKFTRTLKIAKSLIVYSEIKYFATYKSKTASTELGNRNLALSMLIKDVRCKNIIIDNYDNPRHKERMILLGKKLNKKIEFVDSTTSEGIQFVDILLKLKK